MAAFYREHSRVVLTQVLLVVGERVLAAEIVQDTMLAVWRGAGSFRGESSVRSWVIAIARRQTRDRLRGRRLRVVDDAFLADQPGSGPGLEVMALDHAELAEVMGAIRELASPRRELLGLVFSSGLSLPEVAGVLELDDLLAEVNGQAIGDRAQEHLATCEHCRAEAGRWALVAGGVRALAAVAPEPARPAQPWKTGPQVLEGPGRRSLLAASAAAALVLIGGASYAVSTALTGHAPAAVRTGTKTAALTAVSGCASLEQADGTLEQVNGTSLVIKTASGQPVTVTTTASTMMQMFAAPLSDITDGASVGVVGPSSDGTSAARFVGIGSPQGSSTPTQQPRQPRGTVSDASAAGFTVVTPTGTRIPVTTSSATDVILPHPSLSQLQTGARIGAAGHAAPDGRLSAVAVVQPRTGRFAGSHPRRVRGCSPAAIEDAITTALMSGG